MKRTKALPSVTDHAVLRFLERARGIDVEAARREIAALATNGVQLHANAVIAEGVKLVLRENVVVTVLERQWPAPRRPEGGEDA
jgi:hypothetical protein